MNAFEPKTCISKYIKLHNYGTMIHNFTFAVFIKDVALLIQIKLIRLISILMMLCAPVALAFNFIFLLSNIDSPSNTVKLLLNTIYVVLAFIPFLGLCIYVWSKTSQSIEDESK